MEQKPSHGSKNIFYNKKMKNQLKIGIIGMGGFAQAHHNAVYELEKRGILKLVCTCDPEKEKFQQMIDRLHMKERNIVIFDNYIDMLDNFRTNLNIVSVPTPIYLHAEMHREAVKRNLPVYLEKPPTLDYQELADMIRIDQNAEKKTNVGFNFIIQKARQKVKERILSNEFGRIKRITFLGMWPRPLSYFRRNDWAGKLIHRNKVVLDSCFGNAISHYIHNILFWCGQNGILSWDPVETVQAELYRANDIQGTDTVFVIAATKTVRDIRIVLTHACGEKTDDIEKIFCENADIYFEGNAKSENGTMVKCEIKRKNGKKEIITEPNGNLLQENIFHYTRYVAGLEKRPLIRIEDTEPFVLMNGLIYAASKRINSIPKKYLDIVETGQNERVVAIKNIRKIAEEFLDGAAFPSAQGVGWAEKGGIATKEEIKNLHQIIREIAG